MREDKKIDYLEFTFDLQIASEIINPKGIFK